MKQNIYFFSSHLCLSSQLRNSLQQVEFIFENQYKSTCLLNLRLSVVLAKCIRGCVPPPKQNKKCESSSTKIMYNLNYNVRSSTMSSNKIDHHNVSQKNENLSMKQN